MLTALCLTCGCWAGVMWQANGVPVCTVAGTQESPSVVTVDGGGAIVAWADRRGDDYDIYAQRLDANGKAMWASGGVLVCGADYDQQFPAITTDGNGGAIVAWQDGRLGDDGLQIYAQRIGADGAMAWQADGVPVCVHEAGLEDPPSAFSHVIETDGAGGAIIAWRDTRADPITGNTEIYVQRISGTGAPCWTVNGVKVLGFTAQKWATRNPIVASDGAGGAFVAWQDARNAATSANDLYVQRVTAAGTVSWTTNGVPVCTASGDQGYPDIAAVGSGVVLAWEDKRAGNYDIYAQKLDSTGSPQWGANGRLVCGSANDQRTPRVVTDGSGVVIAWTDKRASTLYTDIYAQKLDSTGAAGWAANGTAVCLAAGSQTRVRMCPSYAGSVILTWMDTRNETSVALYDLYAQMLDSAGAARWASDGTPVAALTGSAQRMQQAVSDGMCGLYAVWEDDRTSDWNVFAQRLSPWLQIGDIAAAKSNAPGTPVLLPTRIVTGAFGGFFYIEENERYSGMKVIWPLPVTVGDLVTVAGTVEQDCERYINAYSVTPAGSGTVPDPLAVNLADLGSGFGPSNTGLLVRVWGYVTSKVAGPPQYFVVSHAGAETRVYGSSSADVGDFVTVTGISSCAAGPVPCVLIRGASDVQVLSHAAQ